jgi:putative ABC transport system permease protein
VRERIPEFALLKTLGFPDRAVLALIFSEAFVLCVLAALIGLGLAQIAFGLISSVLGPLSLPPVVIEMGVSLAVLLALVSGSLPAWRSTRINIVDALAGR